MTTKKKIMNLPFIVIAALFLFNPNIAVIDLLPDFIGYILLCVAISRLADVHERVGEAYNAFKKMILIDAGKWIAVFWIFGMTVPSERNTSMLLWTFVFSILEMIFLLPAYNKLFDGITQLGYLYPCQAVFGKREKRSKTDRMRNFTFVFVTVKALLTVLPELSDLTNSTYDETVSGSLNLYRYIGLMRGMAFIPVFVFGMVWLFRIISYFKGIARDSEFTGALALKYDTDVLPRQGVFVRRNFSTFVLIAAVALCLTVDIRIDDNNILPDFIAAALFIVAFAFIGRYNGLKVKDWIFSSVSFTCFSLLASISEYMFFDRYYYGAIIKSDEARYFYMLVVGLNIIKGICLFAVLFDLHKALLRTVKAHTGYVVGMERIGPSEENMIKTLHADLKKNLIYALVSTVLYIASDVCFDIFAPRVDFMGLINIVFALLCIGMYIKAFSEIQHAIDTKYMLE